MKQVTADQHRINLLDDCVTDDVGEADEKIDIAVHLAGGVSVSFAEMYIGDVDEVHSENPILFRLLLFSPCSLVKAGDLTLTRYLLSWIYP